jgi:uncharacterized protein
VKANWVRWFQLFLLVGAVFHLPAQQSEPDSKLLADIRIKAEMGDAVAQYALGYFYEKGRGVVKDETEAAKWYRKAAEQDEPLAQVTLASCYYEGQGVAKDNVEAYRWWLLAARHGIAVARSNVAIMEFKMTPEQISKGQKLARDFRPGLPRSLEDKEPEQHK